MAAEHNSKSRRVPRRKRSAGHALLFEVAKHKRAAWGVVAGVVLFIGAVALILVYTDLSWGGIIGWIDHVHPAVALPLMAVLPILGFPISIVYLFAGVRFGPIGGGLVVAAITAVHMLGTYLISNSFLRAPLQRFIEKRHKHLPAIPEDEQAMVCVIATLVPGLPYFIRNYVLALGGVKLKYFFTVCVPIYVARSYVTILLGDMGGEPTKQKLFILLGVDALKIGICAFVIWRLREHHRKHHGHEHHDDHHDHDHEHGPDLPAPAK